MTMMITMATTSTILKISLHPLRREREGENRYAVPSRVCGIYAASTIISTNALIDICHLGRT
jgi:hypothetical protein